LKPTALEPGATVGIAAPCGPVDPEKLTAGRAVWEAAGFRVVHGDDITARAGYLAGDDARRASELGALVADPAVDAIVCARGGYGCARILERLDPAAFRAARQPLVGYSDVTSLLLWQRRAAGLVGFHGPMLERGDDIDPETFAALVDALSGGPPPSWCGRGLVPGRAAGRLTGGNLALVAASLGTPWEIDTRGAILLLEEVGEPPYRIDRLLQQLGAAKKFAGLVGIGLGALEGCTDERYPDPDASCVVEEVAGTLGIPVVVDLPFGHVKRNLAWPLGARATIDGARGELAILERGVMNGP
jgi:muramoyltetrapeptide carboxypeptidase